MDCASELTVLVRKKPSVGVAFPTLFRQLGGSAARMIRALRHDVLPAFARKFFARFQSRFVALLSMMATSKQADMHTTSANAVTLV